MLLLEGLGLGVHQGRSHHQLLLEGEACGEISEGKGYNESTLQGTWVYVSDRCVTLAINFPPGLPLSVLRSEEDG